MGEPEITQPRFFRFFDNKYIKEILGDELYDKYFEYYKPDVTDDTERHAIDLAGHPIIRQINIDDPEFLVSYIDKRDNVKHVPVTLVSTAKKMVYDPFIWPGRDNPGTEVDTDYKFQNEDGTIFDSIEAMIEHYKSMSSQSGAGRKTRRNRHRRRRATRTRQRRTRTR